MNVTIAIYVWGGEREQRKEGRCKGTQGRVLYIYSPCLYTYPTDSRIIFCAVLSSSSVVYISGGMRGDVSYFPQHRFLNLYFKSVFFFHMVAAASGQPFCVSAVHCSFPGWLFDAVSSSPLSLTLTSWIAACAGAPVSRGRPQLQRGSPPETQASCLCRAGGPGQSSPMTRLLSSPHIHLAGKPIGPCTEHWLAEEGGWEKVASLRKEQSDNLYLRGWTFWKSAVFLTVQSALAVVLSV